MRGLTIDHHGEDEMIRRLCKWLRSLRSKKLNGAQRRARRIAMHPEPAWEDGTPMTAEEWSRDTDEVFGKPWWMRR
jgi:hypothetical protein